MISAGDRRSGRTYLAALLFAAHIIAYADRAVVSVLLPSFKQSLGLTLVEASLIQGMAFSLFFALAGIPIGRAADRHHRLRLLAGGLVIWSIATVACGLSTSFSQLIVARMCVAVGEACLIPTVASLIADSYPPHQRGRAMGFVQIGAPIGSLVAVMGGGALLTWLEQGDRLASWGLGLEGWQAVFLTLGAPGLILTLLLLSAKEPPRGSPVAVAEEAGILKLMKDRPVLFIGFLVLQSMISMETYALLGWAPTILITSYGQTAASAGSIIGMILVGSGITAYILGGVSSDMLARWRPRYGRMIVPGVVLPVSIAALAWLYVADGLSATTVALAAGMFSGALIFSTAVATLQAVVPGSMRGRAVAILYLAINIFGAGLAPTLTAFVAERGLGLQEALALVCLGAMIVALAVWVPVTRAYARAPNYEAAEADPDFSAFRD